MDVYDFDKTLYRGDSTADFLKFCLRRHPRIVATFPRTAFSALSWLRFNAIDKTRFKTALYRFLPYVTDVEGEIERFWRINESKICGPCTPSKGDLVISASPEFLLRDVCRRRGLELIASQVDPHTGAVLGPNCSDDEKPRRFRAAYPHESIDAFYSDSLNDTPLARMAKRAFMVDITRGVVQPWPHDAPSKKTGKAD